MNKRDPIIPLPPPIVCFVFPFQLDHVMLLEGIDSLKLSSYACSNVRITLKKHKRKIPMRASRGLKWENKTYKVKRSNALGLL